MLPLRLACARICIKNYTVTTLIVQLPQTISTALIIQKFLNFCTLNNIGVEFEKHLFKNNYLQASIKTQKSIISLLNGYVS